MEGQHKHFSHTHNLSINQIPKGTQITCSGCNSLGTGNVFACWQCNFFLHEQCFRANRSLKHPSHPSHPLTLLPFPTYPSNSFVCNSCNQVGTGFTYSCSDCEFDLHVKCSFLPETVKRGDHEHQLKLVYSSSVKGQEYTFVCDVCHGIVQENDWTYYCEICQYGTHVECVNCDVKPVKESQDEASGFSSGDPVLEAQLQMQMLQLHSAMANQNAQSFQLGMARQNAQMVMSMSQSFHSSPSNIYDSI